MQLRTQLATQMEAQAAVQIRMHLPVSLNEQIKESRHELSSKYGNVNILFHIFTGRLHLLPLVIFTSTPINEFNVQALRLKSANCL